MSAVLAMAAAGAAEATQRIGHAAPNTPGIGGAVVGLVLVLGLIFALAWVLKRMPGAGVGLRQSEQLKVVGMLAVGARERVVVVQVGAEQLLLGVGPGGISRLHLLPEPLAVAPPPALPDFPSMFASMLAKRLRKES
ncbi:MAG TPA: flagellar biosynthetic protein FliO [Pseudoxanthomonas sp.]|nr:flagellar biosynthetic protein FliO [Pseudoxanthomonas sp.]